MIAAQPKPSQDPPKDPPSVSLWAGVIGAPCLWAIQFEIHYALVPWICGHTHQYLLYLVPAVFFALCLFGGVLCWRELRAEPTTYDDDANPASRNRFLAIV